jgi:glycerate 2-kinase
MKIILAPDSFKGSLSAPQVCDALETGLRKVFADAQIIHCPMADGGEGTLDAVLSAASFGNKATHHTKIMPGASAQPLEIAYSLLPDGAALIESAQIVGITDREAMRTDVASRHTVGIGVLMRVLIGEGVRKFWIGLGGTSTNDAGAGLLVGLGARLFDHFGRIVAPTPVTLSLVTRIDLLDVPTLMQGVAINLLSDVNNPLLGPQGATSVFGPQKGIQPVDIPGNETALRTYADALDAAMGIPSKRESPGAGAAGGLGYTLQMLGATMQSGAHVVADLVGLDTALENADWLITGEGRSDEQTLSGKTPYVAAQRALARNAKGKRTLISGGIDLAAMPALNGVFNGGCFSLVNRPMTLEAAIADSANLLANAAQQCALLQKA